MAKTFIKKLLREYKKRPIIKYTQPQIGGNLVSMMTYEGEVVFERQHLKFEQTYHPSELKDGRFKKRTEDFLVRGFLNFIDENRDFILFSQNETSQGVNIQGDMIVFKPRDDYRKQENNKWHHQ